MEIIGEPAATKDEQIERKSAGRRKERVGSFWGGVDYLGKPRGAPWPLWRGARFFSIRHNPTCQIQYVTLKQNLKMPPADALTATPPD